MLIVDSLLQQTRWKKNTLKLKGRGTRCHEMEGSVHAAYTDWFDLPEPAEAHTP